MMLLLLIFLISLVVECNAATRAGKRLFVHFKDLKSANEAIDYGSYANSNYGQVDVKRSSVDPTITIWKLSNSVTDEYVAALIEYLNSDSNVLAVEEEVIFHPLELNQ